MSLILFNAMTENNKSTKNQKLINKPNLHVVIFFILVNLLNIESIHITTCTVFELFSNSFLNEIICFKINGSCSLIKHQNLGISQQSPTNHMLQKGRVASAIFRKVLSKILVKCTY